MSANFALISKQSPTLAITAPKGTGPVSSVAVTAQTFVPSNAYQEWQPSAKTNPVTIKNTGSKNFLASSTDKKTVITSDTSELWNVNGSVGNPVALQLPEEASGGGYYTATLQADDTITLEIVKGDKFTDAQLWTPKQE
ncbi:hypothetical protein BDR04DRAFT_1104022 [Suillus decipiens]|nr:hypothetical protein BDR04DRAFT_1104022 [Suillus decipiens]